MFARAKNEDVESLPFLRIQRYAVTDKNLSGASFPHEEKNHPAFTVIFFDFTCSVMHFTEQGIYISRPGLFFKEAGRNKILTAFLKYPTFGVVERKYSLLFCGQKKKSSLPGSRHKRADTRAEERKQQISTVMCLFINILDNENYGEEIFLENLAQA
jgi:hypothetical protein